MPAACSFRPARTAAATVAALESAIEHIYMDAISGIQ